MSAPRRPQPALVPLPGARPGRDPDRAIKRGPRRVSAEVVAATQRDRLFDEALLRLADDRAFAAGLVTAALLAATGFSFLFK